jgi:hypothetical protein
MSTITDLQEARELIVKKERWTQGVFARDTTGEAVPPTYPDACQWCALGALRKITGFHYLYGSESAKRYDAAAEILSRAAWAGEYGGIVSTNDEAGHAAVLKTYTKAIELAKGDE